LYNVASCWLYLKEYINDARSHERQIEDTFISRLFTDAGNSGYITSQNCLILNNILERNLI